MCSTRICLISVFIVLLFFWGCSFNPHHSIEMVDIKCRHEVLAVAAAAEEKYDVRIAVGVWKGTNHVQTQAKINGTWEFIKRSDFGKLEKAYLHDFLIKDRVSFGEYINLLRGKK